MATVYFDTSALVKLLVQEEGTALATRLWDGADTVVTHPIADSEIATVLSAAARTCRLTDSEADATYDMWKAYRHGIRWARPQTDVTWNYRIASRHVLRGADLLHLHSALLLHRGVDLHAAPQAVDVVMAVWDPHLAQAATEEGIFVAPRH